MTTSRLLHLILMDSVKGEYHTHCASKCEPSKAGFSQHSGLVVEVLGDSTWRQNDDEGSLNVILSK